jgi:hypothetical protein
MTGRCVPLRREWWIHKTLVFRQGRDDGPVFIVERDIESAEVLALAGLPAGFWDRRHTVLIQQLLQRDLSRCRAVPDGDCPKRGVFGETSLCQRNMRDQRHVMDA